ncbi:MAG: metallophosphoesterase [Acidobacteriota bacterium]
MNRIYFAVFFSITLSIYFLMHFYIFTRLVRDFSISYPLKGYLFFLFLIGSISFIGGEILNRQFSILVKSLIYFGLIWLGVISITLSIFLVSEIFRAIFPSSKLLISYISLSLIIVLTIFSTYNAHLPPKVKEIRVRSRNLAKESKEFTIVQLSDLHLGVTSRLKWLEKVVDTTNNLKPDLIVITGDLIDQDISNINGFSKSLRRLKAEHGVVAVTGNHEFYAGIDKFLKITEKSNIKILRNEKLILSNNLEIIGVDDDTSSRFEGERHGIQNLLSDVDSNRFSILLSHRPKNFELAAKSGVDLQLSGHSHAGQIPPMDLIVFLSFKYPYGLYSYKNSYLYTTSGTGTWGPPMRLFSRSEIVKLILELP